MATWVPQSETYSGSKSARARVAYLVDALGPEVERLVREYFESRPDGEDVTVYVLQHVGKDRLVQIADGAEHLDRVKQDLGRLVPIVLADTYRKDNVLTYREDNRRDVSTRAVRRDGMEWVSRFTPHRVRFPGTADRIALDTCTVRNFIQGTTSKDSLDLDELAREKDDHLVSIADAAWAEIIEALVRPNGGIPFDAWATKVAALDAILDPMLPILPGGRDLTRMNGLFPEDGFDVADLCAYLRAVWQFTKSIKSPADLSRREVFTATNGRRFAIGPMDSNSPIYALTGRGQRWEKFVQRLSAIGAQISSDEAAALLRAQLETEMPPRVVDRLGLLIGVVGEYTARVARSEKPYVADINDAIDIDVLYSAVLPAIVCTCDTRMRSLARAAGSSDAWRVMSPSDLMDWLRRKRGNPTGGANPPGSGAPKGSRP